MMTRRFLREGARFLRSSFRIPNSSLPLFRLDAGFARDLDPFRDLGPVEGVVRLRSVADRFRALAREIASHGRLVDRLDQCAVHAVDDRPRRAGWREQAETARDDEAGNA